MKEKLEAKNLLEELIKISEAVEGKDQLVYLLPFKPIPTASGRFQLGKDGDEKQCLNILFLGLTGSGYLSTYTVLIPKTHL